MYSAIKNPVQRAFSAAANSYDEAACVQRASANSLLAMIPVDHPVRYAMDLGCGTVPLARRFLERFPQSSWLAADLSLGMLQEAQQRGRLGDDIHAVCADAQALPLADGVLDLIFSSFALQWASCANNALNELARVSRSGALLAMVVPLAGTLVELQRSWAAVESSAHVNTLLPMDHWCNAARAAGWLLREQHHTQVVKHYPTVRALAAMLKRTGANTVRNRQSGLVTPARFRAMESAYEQARQPQGLPLTWQLGFLLMEKQ